MKRISLIVSLLLLAASVRAIELSLEENRGERGSVGYVDMQRLFTVSPDAQRAKESFEDLIRQAEESVNMRKAELLKLRQALDAARVDRDALIKTMSETPAVSTAAAVVAPPAPVAPVAVVAVSTPAAPAAVPFSPAPAPVAVSTAAAAPKAVAVSTPAATGAPNAVATAAIPFATSPAPAAVSTAAAPAARPVLALPGMSMPDAAPSAPPAAASSATVVVAPAAGTGIGAGAVAVSTKPAAQAAAPVVSSAAVVAAATMFPMPAAPVVVQIPAGPTPAQRLLELDAKIIGIQADIAHKEAELTHEHDDADRGLLDVESRKTDQVLARLYRAVSEVARREGVSVVIDKSTILYGHQAVDLTDKVLKYLKEAPAAAPNTP
jgi:Skp family chaperone for outer membrane proteins